MKIILQWTQNLTLLFFFSSPNFDKWFSKARMWTPWSDAALYHLKSPFIYRLSLPRCIFISLLLPFGEKETEPGSQNCLNSPNDMKVMKVIRAMLPWTSRPIMACLTFTQPLKACELWCLPLCVSVSASRCLSQHCNSMSNSVSAHTTGLRERQD